MTLAVQLPFNNKEMTGETSTRWRQSALLRAYESLTRNDAVQPADLIFVMAGRMERKQYGLDLFRAGVAPRLVLSVGRFEVSRMANLNLEGFDDLKALREKTPPDERHFFVKVDANGVHIEKVRLPRWSTYGEALALRQFLERENARRIIVVSTDVHLRRVAFTLARVFRGVPVEFLYCPVPPPLASLEKQRWWTRPDDRRFVISEILKLAGYRVILSTPPWTVRWLMRVKG